MVKRIFESYQTEEEAIQAVKELQDKGYKPKDLLLMSNKYKQEVLQGNTEVEVKVSPISRNKGESVFTRIKRVFTQETDPEATEDKLVEYGLSREQASGYAADVEAGNILIVADEESGGSTIRPLIDRNLDPVVSAADSAEMNESVKENGPDVSDEFRVPSSDNPEPSLESIEPAEKNKL